MQGRTVKEIKENSIIVNKHRTPLVKHDFKPNQHLTLNKTVGIELNNTNQVNTSENTLKNDVLHVIQAYYNQNGRLWLNVLIKSQGKEFYFLHKETIKHFLKNSLGWDSSDISSKIYDVEKRLSKNDSNG